MPHKALVLALQVDLDVVEVDEHNLVNCAIIMTNLVAWPANPVLHAVVAEQVLAQLTHGLVHHPDLASTEGTSQLCRVVRTFDTSSDSLSHSRSLGPLTCAGGDVDLLYGNGNIFRIICGPE